MSAEKLGIEITKALTQTDENGKPVFKPEKYGSAEISNTEFRALLKLYKQKRDELSVSKKTLDPDSKEFDKKEIRKAVIETIINKGWPGLENLKLSDLAETAVSHACVVAESLFAERGEVSLPDMVWSYSTKNQFDRYVEKILVENKETNNVADWSEPGVRAEIKEEKVKYPKGVEDHLVHGVGKATRYWPAQLMRYLESIRLDKSTDVELEKYKVGDTNRENYKIPWSNFDEIIKSATKTEDITVGIAIKVLDILKNNGLSDDQLVATIINGYSPTGVIIEHGRVSEIDSVWGRILDEVSKSENLKSIHSKLKEELSKKLK